jgi:hypothetical protein
MSEHLNMKELRTLHENGDWERLANIREELTKRFYFRIEFFEDEWIPITIVINNKLELFLESDENSEHLPFSIILSDKKAGNVETSNRYVYFYLSSYDFSKLLRDAKKIYSEYPDLDRNSIMGIPDTWFADTFLVKFVTEVIIPNRKIQQLLKMPMM